jgi:hypothetical protein
MPVTTTDVVKVFGQGAFLVTSGNPCTYEEGATGDRWCAFGAASSVRPIGTDLFVVNVTKALMPGSTVTCSGTTGNNPDCLRLTTGLAADNIHRIEFFGDTLLYYDESVMLYGWRPGMPNGIELRGPEATDVSSCVGANKGNAVACLQLPITDGALPTIVNIIVGQVTAGATLTRVAQPLLSGPGSFGISQDGGSVIWSAYTQDAGPEILNVRLVSDSGPGQVVANDVSEWSVSPNGSRWYWLSEYNYATDAPAGTLQSAPFPAGTSPTTHIASVAEYVFAANGNLALFTNIRNGRATLRAIADPVGAPTTALTIDTGVLTVSGLSPDGFIFYSKNTDIPADPFFFDFFSKKLDNTGACTLTRTLDGLPQFSFAFPGGGALLWTRVTNATDPTATMPDVDLRLTDLATCASTMVAGGNLGSWLPAGDEAVLYTDDVTALTRADGSRYFEESLRMRRLGAGHALAADPATLIQSRLAGGYYALQPDLRAVFYVMDDVGEPGNGVYLYRTTAAATTAGSAAGFGRALFGSAPAGAAAAPERTASLTRSSLRSPVAWRAGVRRESAWSQLAARGARAHLTLPRVVGPERSPRLGVVARRR